MDKFSRCHSPLDLREITRRRKGSNNNLMEIRRVNLDFNRWELELLPTLVSSQQASGTKLKDLRSSYRHRLFFHSPQVLLTPQEGVRFSTIFKSLILNNQIYRQNFNHHYLIITLKIYILMKIRQCQNIIRKIKVKRLYKSRIKLLFKT